MAVIGLKVEGNSETLRFWKDTEERFAANDLGRNPFETKIKHLSMNETVLIIKPVYPRFWLFGLLPLAIGLFFGWKVSIWIGLSVVFLGVAFWSAPFYALMLYFGLRKSGYKGKVRFMSMNKIVEEMIEHGSN